MAKSKNFRKTIGVPPHGKSKFVQKGSTTANVSTKAKTQSLKQTPANTVKEVKETQSTGFSALKPDLRNDAELNSKDICKHQLKKLKDASKVTSPKFQESMLPDLLLQMATAIAIRSNSSIAYAAICIYVIVSNLLSRIVFVQPFNNNSGFRISPNMSGLIVDNPSTGKSGTLDTALAAVTEVISQHSTRELSDLESLKIAQLKRMAKKKVNEILILEEEEGEDHEEVNQLKKEAAVIQQRINELKQKKGIPDFLLSNLTKAALLKTVSETDYPIIMNKHEVGSILKLSQKPGDVFKELLIELMDGNSRSNHVDGHRTYKTKGKKAGLLGCTQPDTLEKIVGFVNDGLIQRFSLIAFCEKNKVAQDAMSDTHVDGCLTLWEKIIEKLTTFNFKDWEVILPTKDAEASLRQIKADYESKMAEESDRPIIEGLYGKRFPFIASVSLVNAFFRTKKLNFSELTIELEDVECAAEYVEFNEVHFKNAFGLNETKREAKALELLERLISSNLASKSFTVSQVIKKEWRGFKGAALVESLLGMLNQYQLIDKRSSDSSLGGRPTVYWKINQDLLEV
ncbi:DUF3987 domain-containing protein [Alishewanella sp. HH-ZS]|uniref:DUF3987 domain-containing protein n=1 Tax=Alishewanella sp. HH-ZS TaxID=1856684 RepID=UPI000ACD7942|nr:DUF3987 domain-containing protein [Alishewanella sp. HH-ZS]